MPKENSRIVEYQPCNGCNKVMVGKVFKKHKFEYLCKSCRGYKDRMQYAV